MAVAATASNSNGASETGYNITIERRQAISMERLNSIKNSPTSRYLSQIHQLNRGITSSHSNDFIGCKDNSTNSGSLSSGSNSSIDESASDAEQQQHQHQQQQQQLHLKLHLKLQPSHHFHLNNNNNHRHHNHHHTSNQNQLIASTRGGDRPAGLSRSASRVSRFRSAKEFFERLSSINNNTSQSDNNNNNNSNSNSNSPHMSGANAKFHPNSHSPHQQRPLPFKPVKRSPERPQQQHQIQHQHRGNVASRYTEPLAASLGQLAPSAVPALPSSTKSPEKAVFTRYQTATDAFAAAGANHHRQQAVKTSDVVVDTKSRPLPRTTTAAAAAPLPLATALAASADSQEGAKSSNAVVGNNSPLSERLATPESDHDSSIKVVPNSTTATIDTNNSRVTAAAAPAVADATPTVARPRSLLIQPKLEPQTPTPTKQAVFSPPPPPPRATPPTPPSPSRSLGLQQFLNSSSSSSSSSSCSSAYVKLKTTDHSGLSTNTILHINNSQSSRNSINCSNSTTNKSVINEGDNLCNNNGSNHQHHPEMAVLAFQGDNVIIGSGLLLVKRNKQLRIKFDESSTATFEYPSEEALMDEFSSGADNSDAIEAGSSPSSTMGPQAVVTTTPAPTNSDSQVTIAPVPALQSAGGLLPNQRLMWRQSFGLLLSNQNNLESATNLECSPSPVSVVNKDNQQKQTTPALGCLPVVVVDQKDDQWKGEW